MKSDAQGIDWISTADEMPESGRWVLAFFVNGCGMGRTIRAQYAARFSLEQAPDCDGGEYNEEDDIFYCNEGWYETNEYEETHWAVDDEVTYWMPLPAPPAAIAREEASDDEG